MKKWQKIVGIIEIVLLVVISVFIIQKYRGYDLAVPIKRFFVQRQFESIKKPLRKIKTVHVHIEQKAADKVVWTQDADLSLPNNSQGTIKYDDEGEKTKEFRVIDQVAYVRLQGEEKFGVYDLINFPAVYVPNPLDLVNKLENSPKWQKKELDNRQVLESYNQLPTNYWDPLAIGKYSSKVTIDEKTKRINQVVITEKIGSTELQRTITYSDFDKKVDIQKPKDEELVKLE